MRSVVVLLIAAAASLALGLWSAWLAVRSPAPVDTIALGAWQAWPNAGTRRCRPLFARAARPHRRNPARLRRRSDAARADRRCRRPARRSLRLHDRRADAAGAALDGVARKPRRARRQGAGRRGGARQRHAAARARRLVRDRAVAAAAERQLDFHRRTRSAFASSSASTTRPRAPAPS